jgi:putative hydrolase of the HAD superfamily
VKPASITTVVSDFGGVLTTPLMNSFAAFQDQTGIESAALGRAMQTIAERDGAHPLFELETGRMTEVEFLAGLESALEPELGRRPQLHGFREIYFEALDPNEPMIELMREIRASGRRMALLTNNVREWEPLWRSMLPVDEIFELVVDSGFVGVRKPDVEIYELTLARLNGVSAEECLFVDDVQVNIETARAIGMTAVHFRDNDQAIGEIRTALALGSDTRPR